MKQHHDPRLGAIRGTPLPDQISCQVLQAIVSAFRPAVFNGDVLALDIAGFVEALPEGNQASRDIVGLRRPAHLDSRSLASAPAHVP